MIRRRTAFWRKKWIPIKIKRIRLSKYNYRINRKYIVGFDSAQPTEKISNVLNLDCP